MDAGGVVDGVSLKRGKQGVRCGMELLGSASSYLAKGAGDLNPAALVLRKGFNKRSPTSRTLGHPLSVHAEAPLLPHQQRF